MRKQCVCCFVVRSDPSFSDVTLHGFLLWCTQGVFRYLLWKNWLYCISTFAVRIETIRVSLWRMFSSLFSLFSFSTASNSNKSTPACSPVLRKRSRSPTPQSPEGENMVEKGSDHSSDKSPSTPEQVVQRTYSLQSARSGGKNSKVSDHGRRSCFTCLTHVFGTCLLKMNSWSFVHFYWKIKC